MPLKRCSSDGKSGWKFGDKGKCFTGPDAKKKAAKQGAAIKISQGEGVDDELIDLIEASEMTVKDMYSFLTNNGYVRDLEKTLFIQEIVSSTNPPVAWVSDA